MNQQDSPPTNEKAFIAEIKGESYRDALASLLDHCRRLDLRFEWGPAGTSFRLLTPDRKEPLSIAWLFPPDNGWYGLRGFNMGFDPWSAGQTPSMTSLLEDYIVRVSRLSGVRPVKTKKLRAFCLDAVTTVRCQTQVADILEELVDRTKAQR